MNTQSLVPYTQSALAVPLGNLEAYIGWSAQIPLLSKEEESELAHAFYKNNDLEAARKLILAHLRYVIKIARGYIGYGLPLGDLIQEGNVGLMKGVKRFNPEVGVRLVTFVVYWIKSEIHNFIVKNWKIVKIATTKAQRKLFFNLRSYKKEVGTWFTNDEVKMVSDDLNVSEAEVLRMEQRLYSVDKAFDAPLIEDDDKAFLTPASYLEDTNADPAKLVEASKQRAKGNTDLFTAMATLDERSQDILQSRWLADKKATLHELAAKYNVSAERIRQLENNAMAKIKKALEADSLH